MNDVIDGEILKQHYCILIVGDTGSGKTALSFRIVEELQDKEIYFVRHPKPKLIEKFGYRNIYDLNEMMKLEDSVIVWDEFQLSFVELSNFKADQSMIRIMSLLRQRGNTLILSTSDSRAVSPRMEAYIKLWIIKQCDYDLMKQRGKVRRIIEKNSIIPSFPIVNLDLNEALVESTKVASINGRHTFQLASNWTEDLSTAYRGKIQ